jgi:hypothetical protein
MADQKAISAKIKKIYEEERAKGRTKKQALKIARGKSYGMARSGRLGPRGGYTRVRRKKRKR